MNSKASNLCNFVGYYLQPFLQKLTSCVKDAPDLHIHEDTKAAILVTMHVKYLHDNIHNQEYIEALKETLKSLKAFFVLQIYNKHIARYLKK